MKIDFTITSKDYTEYCIVCHNPNTLQNNRDSGKLVYSCSACGSDAPRAIIIDPKLKWSILKDKEYCHESVGAFIFNKKGKFLMFALNKFPFGNTIPAGHVDAKETAQQAVIREVHEETGLSVTNIEQIAQTTIHPDSCRRGADTHSWTVFCCIMASDETPVIDSHEGSKPEWVSIETASSRANCPAVDYILKNYRADIAAYARSTAII